MKKRDIIEGVITEYDFPNKASFRLEDKKVLVKGALPGQRVCAMVTKNRKDKCEARLLEVLTPSPLENVEASCSYFGKCGGCTYQAMSYENQLELKASMVKKLLDGVIDTDAHPYTWEGIIGSPISSGYRNKMEYSFGDEYKDGPLSLGLHKKNSMYDIVHVDDCDIVDQDFNTILKFTQEFARSNGLTYHKKMQHVGLLRHLVLRRSFANGGVMVNLITSSDGVDALDMEAYASGLLALQQNGALNGHVEGILHTINDSLADVVQSDETKLIYGSDFLTENILGLNFKISPFSFFQTNSKSCERLYAKAREYVGETKDKLIFDLYSGTGTIAQLISPVAKKVIGVEIVEEAVEAAKENAKLNGLNNCEFIAGDVLKVIDDIHDKPDIIILDPPRDGCNPKALAKIIAYGVKEIVYISCKPTSLARDLVLFQENGYHLVKACAVDQFPMTQHTETVALLSKKHPSN